MCNSSTERPKATTTAERCDVRIPTAMTGSQLCIELTAAGHQLTSHVLSAFAYKRKAVYAVSRIIIFSWLFLSSLPQ